MAMDPGPVLVLNAGSSTLKVSLQSADGTCLWREQRPWGGTGGPEELLEHWLGPLLERMLAGGQGPGPALVGHRVVHGGERFTAPTRLDGELQEALEALEALLPLAPLHNGAALTVIRWLQSWLEDSPGKVLPRLGQWACFDTAFHHSLPPEARTYALPAAWREQGLRRFGFHGLNHQHVSEEVERQLGQDRAGGKGPAPLRLISCHLGAGCSLCAVLDGRSIATTMGFTPLEGLVMGTRSGSIDPGLLLHQLRRGLGAEELEQVLQQQSGLLGLSGFSSDMAELRRAAARGHGDAALAIAVFRRRLLEGIGAMAACLGGVDVIALSGGIGANDRELHAELRRDLTWLPPHRWLVVPADEEGVIARSCLRAAGMAVGGR